MGGTCCKLINTVTPIVVKFTTVRVHVVEISVAVLGSLNFTQKIELYVWMNKYSIVVPRSIEG